MLLLFKLKKNVTSFEDSLGQVSVEGDVQLNMLLENLIINGINNSCIRQKYVLDLR